MSLYSGSLKTQYLDPRIDQSNNRVEFRFDPETAYYSNLRLVNFGCTGNATDNNTINSQAGLLSLIKNARLMDGAVELDSLRNAGKYLAFRTANNSNSDNANINSKLLRAKVGYYMEDTGQVLHDAGNPVNRVRTSANSTDANDAYIDLRRIFPILENISYLDTTLFPNLKIVIEYDTSALKLALATNTDTLTTKTPLLVCDEIMDKGVVSKLRSKFNGVVYAGIEDDLFVIPSKEATSAGLASGVVEKQVVNQRLNGFDNKILGRIVVMKQASDTSKYNNAGASLGFGPHSSLAQVGEKVNFNVNGVKILTGDGIDTPAKQLAYLHDTWGEFNMLPFSNELSVGANTPGALHNRIGTPNANAVGGGANESPFIGQASYLGIDLSTRVSQLEINYEREIIKDTTAAAGDQGKKYESAALDVHVYAEVQKQLKVGANGRYTITYL